MQAINRGIIGTLKAPYISVHYRIKFLFRGTARETCALSFQVSLMLLRVKNFAPYVEFIRYGYLS